MLDVSGATGTVRAFRSAAEAAYLKRENDGTVPCGLAGYIILRSCVLVLGEISKRGGARSACFHLNRPRWLHCSQIESSFLVAKIREKAIATKRNRPFWLH